MILFFHWLLLWLNFWCIIIPERLLHFLIALRIISLIQQSRSDAKHIFWLNVAAFLIPLNSQINMSAMEKFESVSQSQCPENVLIISHTSVMTQ